MSKTDILVTRRARRDLKRIWRYIASDNEEAGDRLLLAIDAIIERLRMFPELGATREDIRPGARSLVHGAYLILYEYNAAAAMIAIVAVVEAMRDLDALF